VKTTIPNWTGQSSVDLSLIQATDQSPALACISQVSGGHSFFHGMDEAGLSKLICDAIHVRNLMRVQPKIIPGEALESGEFIPADELNKGKS